jgi:hypothetical protein
MKMKFDWIDPPEKMIDAIEAYGEKAMTAVLAVAQYFAQGAQNDMRGDAKWEDRTGNARSGLFSQAEMAAGDVVTIYLSHGHSVDYGAFLELGNAGKYAIIMPTLEKNMPNLQRMLDEIFQG